MPLRETPKLLVGLRRREDLLHHGGLFICALEILLLTYCSKSLICRGRLRSSTSARRVTVGDRSVAAAGPRLWNSLYLTTSSLPHHSQYFVTN